MTGGAPSVSTRTSGVMDAATAPSLTTRTTVVRGGGGEMKRSREGRNGGEKRRFKGIGDGRGEREVYE